MFRARLLSRPLRRLGQHRRLFATETQHNATPPPPPPPSSSGSASWIVFTAALLGGGYYFKDDILKLTGNTTEKVEEAVVEEVKEVAVEEIKEVVEKAEKVLESEIEKVVVETAVKTSKPSPPKKITVDWDKLKEEILDLIPNESFIDESAGPIFVRLAWHSAGTYDKTTKTGGTEGAGMRYEPESGHGANAGLHRAREILAPLKAKYEDAGLTYSDLWSFAGTVAIEDMGGPSLKWRPGRKDYVEGEKVIPDGRLPNADDEKDIAAHIRSIFNRMGFDDQEMVALIGAHALGRCSVNNSGYTGPWTFSPTTFSNQFFELLLNETWTVKTLEDDNKTSWTGPMQYTDATNTLMMLPSDMELKKDPKFRKWVEVYAKDEEKFFDDFAKAWNKLQENGVKKFHGWRRYIFFGPRE